MGKETIYLKGDPGFRPAVLTKLGSSWIMGGNDIGEDIISFTMPEKIDLEELKNMIGETIITEFSVSFFNKMPDKALSEPQWKFVPGSPIKMSIWASKDWKPVTPTS
jgi:hypothetical protein